MFFFFIIEYNRINPRYYRIIGEVLYLTFIKKFYNRFILEDFQGYFTKKHLEEWSHFRCTRTKKADSYWCEPAYLRWRF